MLEKAEKVRQNDPESVKDVSETMNRLESVKEKYESPMVKFTLSIAQWFEDFGTTVSSKLRSMVSHGTEDKNPDELTQIVQLTNTLNERGTRVNEPVAILTTAVAVDSSSSEQQP